MISRALLLVALLGTATVPSGFMRASGPGGMRLVLCTPDGPQEVWLTEAGEVVPVDDRQDHDPPQCIQVSVAGTDMPPRFGALIRLPPWPTAPPLAFDQRATAQANPNHHRARAPPFPA
nr:hypothetical protein [Sagittula salina]